MTAVLKAPLKIGTGIVFIQETCVARREISYLRIDIRWNMVGEWNGQRVALVVRKGIRLVVESRTDLVYYLYVQVIDICEIGGSRISSWTRIRNIYDNCVEEEQLSSTGGKLRALEDVD